MLIVKLGGSVVQENLTEINPKVFKCINKLISLNIPMVIVTGGGKICRLFQNTLRKEGYNDNENLNRVGTRVVNLQSEFVRSILPLEKTFPKLIDSEEVLSNALNNISDYQYFAAGGWKTGHSSDFDAANMAINFKVKEVLRISDVDYVYDSDPGINPGAKILEKVGWQEYLDIIGNPDEFEPGSSLPVDSVAANLAKEHQLIFYFTSIGRFLEMDKLDFRNFGGTVIGY